MVTPAPAVTVVAPAPFDEMKMVSPTPKMESSTVTVFADATFMTTRLPTSPPTSV
jgi:hypothetical protein